MIENSRSETERALADVWAGVLQRPEEISREDNFFALGGDSIMMMMMIIQISQKFDVELPPEQVFENPTLSGVAAAIDEMKRIGTH